MSEPIDDVFRCPDAKDPAYLPADLEPPDLTSRADAGRSDKNEDDLDFSCGGKLPADHPDADLLDDLDL